MNKRAANSLPIRIDQVHKNTRVFRERAECPGIGLLRDGFAGQLTTLIESSYRFSESKKVIIRDNEISAMHRKPGGMNRSTAKLWSSPTKSVTISSRSGSIFTSRRSPMRSGPRMPACMIFVIPTLCCHSRTETTSKRCRQISDMPPQPSRWMCMGTYQTGCSVPVQTE